MKPTLLLLFLLCTCGLAAQKNARYVQENNADDAYSLNIRLNDDRREELTELYLELAGSTVKSLTGIAETTTPTGVLLRLNTYRNHLRIAYATDDATANAAGSQLVATVKSRLGIEPPPAPPAPPARPARPARPAPPAPPAPPKREKH